jgi:CHAT domain
VPAEVAGVWVALGLPGTVAGERLASAGRALAEALLGPDAQEVLAGLLEQMTAQDTVEVVLCADGEALGLPVELLRLRTAGGGEAGPLGLLPAVAVCRRPQAWRGETDVPPPQPAPRAGLAGPLKVLAVVAAPEETRTANQPLDVEAEMAAVLDAVAGITAAGQVRVLEVASLQAIRKALETDAYHVLHLSAHGSAEAVELEDEDGNPVTVGLRDLVQALELAGRVAARTAYQAGLDIAVRLGAADPANTGWQRDLSVSQDRLGDVAVAVGDLAAPGPPTRPPWTSRSGWAPPTRPTPNGSATWTGYGRRSAVSTADHRSRIACSPRCHSASPLRGDARTGVSDARRQARASPHRCAAGHGDVQAGPPVARPPLPSGPRAPVSPGTWSELDRRLDGEPTGRADFRLGT